MKIWEVMIPLIASVYVTVEAETEGEALDEADRLFDNGEIDTEGYDPEPNNYWEASEVVGYLEELEED